MSTKPKKYIINLDLNDDFSLKNNVSFVNHALDGNNLDFPYLDVSVYFINFILRNNTLAVSFDDVETEFIKQSDGLIDLYEESFTYYDSEEDGGENYVVNASFDEFLTKVLIFIKTHFDSLIRMAGIIQSYIKWPVNLYKIKILYSDSRHKDTITLTKIASGILLYLEDYIPEECVNKTYQLSPIYLKRSEYNKLSPETIKQFDIRIKLDEEEIERQKNNKIAADSALQHISELRRIDGEINNLLNNISVRMNGKTHEIPTEQCLGDTNVKELKNLPFSVEEIQQKLKERFPELNLDVNRGNSPFNKSQLPVATTLGFLNELADNINLSSLKFNTPRDRIIFGLTKLKGEERLRFLGVTKKHIEDKDKRDKWFSYMVRTLADVDSLDSYLARLVISAIVDCLRKNIWPVILGTDTFNQ